MLKLILIIFAIYSVSARIPNETGANVGKQAVSKASALCFKNTYNKVILEILSKSGTVNPNFADSVANLREFGNTNIDAIVRVNDDIAPEKVCSTVAGALPKDFYGVVWLHVEIYSFRQEKSKRVPYLDKVITECFKRGISTGIFSKLLNWSEAMGGIFAGSDTLREVPLWYQGLNGHKDFNDWYYNLFGVWPRPAMKEFESNVNNCGMKIDGLDFY